MSHEAKYRIEKARAAALDAALEALAISYQEALDLNNDLRDIIDNRDKEIEEVRERVSELLVRQSRLEEFIADLKKDRAKVMEDLSVVKGERNRALAKLEVNETEFRTNEMALTERLETAHQTISELQHQSEETFTENQQLQNKICQLRKSLDQKDKMLSDILIRDPQIVTP